MFCHGGGLWSAGTGKSYLLTSVYLWCLVNKKKAKAAAPTGIAAANVEIDGTSVSASTIHNLCQQARARDELRASLRLEELTASSRGSILTINTWRR